MNKSVLMCKKNSNLYLIKREIITTKESSKDIFKEKFKQHVATTSEIKLIKNILNLFMHHQVELIKMNRKKKRKTTSCMSVIFLLKEYFRVQRNLFNSL